MYQINQLIDIGPEWVTTVAVLLLFYLVYKLSTLNFDYWKERGVPYDKPLPFVGNCWKLMTMKVQIGHFLADFYNQFSTPYFGIFIFNKPHLIIRDPELVKLILVQDFYNFSDRTIEVSEKNDSIAANVLFSMKNPTWKYTRSKIAPVFSTKKLKDMIPLMKQVANEMKTYLEDNSTDNIEAKELCAKYSTDIIASCAFGVNAKSFHMEDAEFRKISRLVFDARWKTTLSQTFHFVAPSIVKFLGLSFFDERFTNFIRRVFWETYNDRENTNIKRNDLIDIIRRIQETSQDNQEIKFEGDRLVAQAAQFFTAGFETVSSVMSFTLYELSLNEEIHQKVTDEIQACLSKNGEVSFEALKDLTYLDMVLLEIVRKYPGLAFLDRICHENYQVPNSNFVIEKGTPIYIPIFGLHYDPVYFPEPEKFIPERFSAENKDSFPEYAYIPFGKGPRICIGERFGWTACKLGLVQILSEYKVERNAETPVPLEYETKGFLLASKVGLPIKLTRYCE